MQFKRLKKLLESYNAKITNIFIDSSKKYRKSDAFTGISFLDLKTRKTYDIKYNLDTGKYYLISDPYKQIEYTTYKYVELKKVLLYMLN